MTDSRELKPCDKMIQEKEYAYFRVLNDFEDGPVSQELLLGDLCNDLKSNWSIEHCSYPDIIGEIREWAKEELKLVAIFPEASAKVPLVKLEQFLDKLEQGEPVKYKGERHVK